MPFRIPGQCVLLFLLFIAVPESPAVLLERVVATIDNTPVLLSELREFRERLSSSGELLNEREALERLIDRKVLLLEARRLRLDRIGTEPLDEQTQIDRYVDIAIRTFAPGADRGSASEPAVQRRGQGLFSLVDRESGNQQFNRKLDEKIETLRKGHKIDIYLNAGNGDDGRTDDAEGPKPMPSN